MSSHHLVDPELLPLLELLPTVTITDDNLAARRARRLPFAVVDDGRVALERVTIAGPGDAPAITLHVYRPADAPEPLPTILHIHGGGLIAGSAAQLEAIHRPLVADLGCALVSVDYRLAPEARYPAAIDDCLCALEWVVANAVARGFRADRIGVVGESAGGGLAAALALMVRDRGGPPLAFQHLIYPMLDDRTGTTVDPHPFTGEFLWHSPNNRYAWRAMLGHEPGRDGVSPYAAPARAGDLSRLPPTFISVGALDLFLGEDVDYARRLLRAGVPVELHVWPGAIHGFDLVPDAAVARAANAASHAALRRFLHGTR